MSILTQRHAQATNLGSAVEEPAVPVGNHFLYEPVKRVVDAAAASFALLLFLPLVPFLFLLVRLESDGPFLFGQERAGRYGRVFRCYKIRSMIRNAEQLRASLSHLNEADGAAFKIREDPRVTRVGRFVRRSSLDEFPQLINVLRGEMSLVGPRPQVPDEVARYSAQDRVRLLVKPGITCLWQISGRNDVDFGEWMRLDGEYVRRRSLKLDFWILMRTVPAVIARKGAY
jgi:lipopolysaccharide/colanic/teichoic acid biosynthesis glycosyltransferase